MDHCFEKNYKGFPCYRVYLPHRPTCLFNIKRYYLWWPFWYINENNKSGDKTNTIWLAISNFCEGFPCFRPYMPHRPTAYSFNMFELKIDNVKFVISFCLLKQAPRLSFEIYSLPFFSGNLVHFRTQLILTFEKWMGDWDM